MLMSDGGVMDYSYPPEEKMIVVEEIDWQAEYDAHPEWEQWMFEYVSENTDIHYDDVDAIGETAMEWFLEDPEEWIYKIRGKNNG